MSAILPFYLKVVSIAEIMRILVMHSYVHDACCVYDIFISLYFCLNAMVMNSFVTEVAHMTLDIQSSILSGMCYGCNAFMC